MDTNKDTASKKMLQEALMDNKDFLRERVRDFCQNLLEEEMEAHLGAKKYQRINSRSGYRNGYKPRTIKTRVGTLNLAVPQDRDGNFCPKLFDRYQRNEKALVSAMMEAYLAGVSTRKVSKLTEALCGTSFSAATVSAITSKLDSQIKAWKVRKLNKAYPYLIVDATYIKVRIEDTVVSQGAIIAVGIDSCGYREILALEVANSETYQAYDSLFRDLKARSLSGIRLIISDDHKGLKKAVDKHFQGAAWQRCNFHFIRNLLDTVPRSKRKYTYSDLKTIFSSSSKAEALARSAEVTAKYEKSYPRFVEKLEAGILDGLSYMDFPIEHWSRIRTTNLVERLNAEIKRRTNVVRIFPNLASAERLLCALAIEQNEEWITGRKYLNMEYLKNYSHKEPCMVKDKDKVLVALT